MHIISTDAVSHSLQTAAGAAVVAAAAAASERQAPERRGGECPSGESPSSGRWRPSGRRRSGRRLTGRIGRRRPRARRGPGQLGRSVAPTLDRLVDGPAEGALGSTREGHEPRARSARACAGHPGQAHAGREAQDVCIRAARCARAAAAGRTLACQAVK